MALTLGQQLDEVQISLSAAREAMSYKQGDKEIQRSYKHLLNEKKDLLRKIETHGSNHIEGQNTQLKKAVVNVSFS